MDIVLFATHLQIIFLSSVFIQGLQRNTQTQQVDVAVQAGHEACLQCPLSYSTDVLQVMWQKILPEDEVTVATCHVSRHKLNPDFSTKISLRDTGLRNCSIVIQNVTEQDEGCYLCLFITSSDVAYTGRACLHMFELHEPILNMSRSNSTEEMELSCSATGRPAPDVTLHVQQTNWIHTNTVVNSNGTVTVIQTAAVSLLHMNKTQECRCSVTSPFGSKQKLIKISDFEHIETQALSSPSKQDSTLALCIGLSVFCGCVLLVVSLLIMKRLKSSDDVENTNVEKEGLSRGTTPLKQSVKDEDETVRKRTPIKEQSAISPPMACRKLLSETSD